MQPCPVTRGRRPASLSPARPRGCVRLRGSASRRRRKRSSPAPVRPRGAPFSLRAIGGLALRCEIASALRLCTLQAPRTWRDLASLGRARNGAGENHAFLPPGRAGRPLRGDRPVPPARGTFPFPGPGRPHYVRTAGPRALRPAPRPHKHADASLVRVNIILSFGPSADTRYAVTASALRPFFPLPAPGATSLRLDAPDRGFNAVGVATARPRGRSARLLIGAPVKLPDSSFVGDRQPRASFSPRRGDTCVTPLLGGRRDSPSASLRTRHVSLFAPSPSRPLTRTPGRRTAPPCGRDRPGGRFPLSSISRAGCFFHLRDAIPHRKFHQGCLLVKSI